MRHRVFVAFFPPLSPLRPSPHSLVAESFNVAPLIIDTEHSTRFPAELEDERFGPSSTTLPTPVGDAAGVGMSYFIQRIR